MRLALVGSSGPVSRSLAPAPVVDADHAGGRGARLITPAAPERPQEGVLALGRAEARHQPAGRTAAGDMGDQALQFDDPARPAGVRPRRRQQTVAEGLDGAPRIDAPPSRQSEPKPHRRSLSGQILELADMPAVPPARSGAACRAAPAVIRGRRHGPAAVHPLDLRDPDADAERPPCTSFHGASARSRHGSANRSTANRARSQSLSQIHTK